MRHKIPVHLQTPDTLLFNMTARQVLIVAVGITLCYTTISSTWNVPLFLIPSVVLGIAILIITLLIAFVAPKKRHLDVWALVVLHFLLSPKRYVWRPLRQETVRIGTQGQASERGLDSEEEEE